MLLRFIFSIFFISILQNPSVAQENAGPPKKDQSLKSKRKLRKEDKKKWKEARRNKRAEEKKIKEYHKRLQTKEVRKRMKRSKKTSMRNNTNQREPFFQRLFQKKRGKSSRQPKEKTSRSQ